MQTSLENLSQNSTEAPPPETKKHLPVTLTAHSFWKASALEQRSQPTCESFQVIGSTIAITAIATINITIVYYDYSDKAHANQVPLSLMFIIAETTLQALRRRYLAGVVESMSEHHCA